MTNTNLERRNNQITPVNNMKQLLENKGIADMFKNALGEHAGAFIASIIDVYNSDYTLQKCDPKAVVMEALKAATLKLPINKNLGFAYIVPYKNQPQMQIGYKGYIQLAMRTGQYNNINTNIVYEGMEIEEDYLSGRIRIKGQKKSDKAIGYFCYFSLINGFEKILYMSTEVVTAHAKKYSKSFNYASSAWKTDFDKMALKTVTRLLISKYGPMSTELERAITQEEDADVISMVDDNNATESIESEEVIDEETGEVLTASPDPF